MAGPKNARPTNKYSAPPEKKENLLASLLLFPWKIERAYAQHGKKIRKIIKIAENSKKTGIVEDCKYRLRRQNQMVLLYIVMPIFIGLGYSGFKLYQERHAVTSYVRGLKAIVTSIQKPKVGIKYLYGKESTFGPTKERIKKLGLPPIGMRHIYPLLIAHMVSFFGALMISMNRAFSKREKLQLIFARRKMLDADEKPWEVCWTPTAILIVTWNYNPEDLLLRKEIWGEADLSPNVCIKDPKNPSIVVLAESQDLPQSVEIQFDEKVVSNVAKDSPKALDAAMEGFLRDTQTNEVARPADAVKAPLKTTDGTPSVDDLDFSEDSNSGHEDPPDDLEEYETEDEISDEDERVR